MFGLLVVDLNRKLNSIKFSCAHFAYNINVLVYTNLFLPCNICCCIPTACNCCNKCNEAGVIDSVAVKIGLDCCGGFGNIDGVAGDDVAIIK